VVASISGQSNKSLLYAKATEQNSPSAIDEEYKKYNLRDESHNTTYMPQPYILRGIQRKGNEKPQYWGFGSKSGFDDGLIRGGVVTVADRIVADTVRIAKFMASPKGLLWIVKQVGLGLTNPKVEANGGPLTRQTRIHTGVASLLSVPGTALGLHFTRHGIPFANETASYENVIKFKQNPLSGNSNYSRLVSLKTEFATGKVASTTFEQAGDKVKILITKGLGSPILSGLAGPQSVYGIGTTQIRRVVDTSTNAIANALRPKSNWEQLYFPSQQYASLISKSPAKSAIEITNYKDAPFDDRGEITGASLTYEDRLNKKRVNLKNKLVDTPFKDTQDKEIDISTTATRNAATSAVSTGIDNYATLAYGKLKKDKTKSYNDFRNEITANDDTKKILGTGVNEGATQDYYTKNNLEGRYGFSKSAPVEGTTPLGEKSFKVKGTQFKRSGDRKILSTNGYGGDKVTALDISSGTTKLASDQVYESGVGEDLIKFFFEDGDQGYNVMPFRCTMTGFSDSFSPGWNRIDIMGRPDGAYLYSSFERAISFSFIAAATTRSEMIPMWRKLNYLASYTMPDFNAGGRPSGPFMRITIGDLFQRTPGFLTSLTYNIPDDATWDIASDSADNPDAKQLPMVIEANVSFTIVSDYRPQMMGRVYSLSPGGSKDPAKAGQWLADAET
jgi:hypothetical protein